MSENTKRKFKIVPKLSYEIDHEFKKHVVTVSYDFLLSEWGQEEKIYYVNSLILGVFKTKVNLIDYLKEKNKLKKDVIKVFNNYMEEKIKEEDKEREFISLLKDAVDGFGFDYELSKDYDNLFNKKENKTWN